MTLNLVVFALSGEAHWLSVGPLHTGINGLFQPCFYDTETRSEDEPLLCI